MSGGVLDAWAVLAWLENQAGAQFVQRRLNQAHSGRDRLSLSIVNAGEVFYRLAKAGDLVRAEELTDDLRRYRLPIQVVPASNPRVWRAAKLKARYPIAYAGAFAAALAQELDVPLITGDPDFAVLERHRECVVQWIGGRPVRTKP